MHMQIVDRDSAVLFIKDSNPIILNKDHVTMVKFSSASDPDYCTVLGVIHSTVRDDVQRFLDKNWSRENGFQGIDSVCIFGSYNQLSWLTGSNKVISHDWVPIRRCTTTELSRISPFFCGRNDEIELIGDGLRNGQPPDVPARFAVFGISGLGKSQLLMQYATIGFASQQYRHIFWIAADTEAKLIDGFSSILNKVDHPEKHCQKQSDKVAAATRWLEDFDPTQACLIVLDHVVHSTMGFLREALPAKNQHVHIVISTQWANVAHDFVNGPSRSRESVILALQGLDVEDATDLLLVSSGVSQLDASDDERVKAQVLVKRTGCHPLGISFAAAAAASMKSFKEILEWTDIDQLSLVR